MSEPTTLPPEHATHTVFNQPPPLEDVNLLTSDRVLTEALRREGAEWAESQARGRGGGGAPGGGAGGLGGRGAATPVGSPANRPPAGPAHARPQRQPDRR